MARFRTTTQSCGGAAARAARRVCLCVRARARANYLYNKQAVYHPTTGANPFATVGFTGFVGAVSGVNSVPLMISEIGVSFPDDSFGAESVNGIPFVVLLKDILQARCVCVCVCARCVRVAGVSVFACCVCRTTVLIGLCVFCALVLRARCRDWRCRCAGASISGVPPTRFVGDCVQKDTSLVGAIDRITSSNRTCDLILGVGDGSAKEFRAFEYSASVANVFDDTNMMPLNDTWHPRMKDIVYYGMDWYVGGMHVVDRARRARARRGAGSARGTTLR